MFESVMKTSCEIIESCWSKERAPVDTFIMGLAASIRERNDYDEQVLHCFCEIFMHRDFWRLIWYKNTRDYMHIHHLTCRKDADCY